MSHYTLNILASITPAETRIESLEGENHLVFPVVALIGDTVIQASNAPTPELIPVDVIVSSLDTWGSRPIICGSSSGHPKRNGKAVSAINPEIFTSSRIGTIFNPTVNESGKLILEAWMSLSRCADIGGDAKMALETIQNGEVINVSVGAGVITRDEKGIANGTEYGAVWESITGDHLAFLPKSLGACSVDMGCGAPRVMEVREQEQSANLSVSKEIQIMEENNEENKSEKIENKRSLLSRFFSKFRSALVFDDGESDQDLRSDLSKALKKVDSAFDWITCVYAEKNVVIYTTYIIAGYSYTSEYHYWRRTYSVGEDGSITLNDDAVEVYPKEVWETVKKDGTTETETKSIVTASMSGVNHDCSCKGEKNMSTSEVKKEEKKEEVSEPKVAAGETEKILKQATQNVNEGFDEQVLRALASLSEEQILSARPELKAIVSKQRQAEEARKGDLIKSLSALGKLTEDRLKLRSLEDLEEMAVLAGVNATVAAPVDYSFRQAAPIDGDIRAAENGWRKLPDPWNIGKKATG